MVKICINCKHFRIITKVDDYSEWTTGNDFDMECLKNKWDFDPYLDDEKIFRKKLSTAKGCKYFSNAFFVNEYDKR